MQILKGVLVPTVEYRGDDVYAREVANVEGDVGVRTFHEGEEAGFLHFVVSAPVALRAVVNSAASLIRVLRGGLPGKVILNGEEVNEYVFPQEPTEEMLVYFEPDDMGSSNG